MVVDFKKLAWDWFDYKKKTLRPSTIAVYYNVVVTNLIPYFSKYNEITAVEVQAYVLYCTHEKNYSKRSVVDHIKLLCNVLNFKNKGKKIEFNIDMPSILKMRERKSSAFSKSDIKKLKKHAAKYALEDIHCLGILISLSLGLRIGEVTGLKFSDFNFNNKTVHIQRTAQRVTVFDAFNKPVNTRIMVGKPKTKSSNRVLPVPTYLFELIKKKLQIVSLQSENYSDYIFNALYSDSLLDNRLLREHFKIILEELNIPHKSFHALRHSFATNCIASSVDVKTTSSMLGHADSRMTLSVYTHPTLEQKKAAVNKLGRLFSYTPVG